MVFKWVPGHRDIAGNETEEMLARQCTGIFTVSRSNLGNQKFASKDNYSYICHVHHIKTRRNIQNGFDMIESELKFNLI